MGCRITRTSGQGEDTNDSFSNVEHETVVVRMFQRQLSKEEFYKFADLIWAQAKDTCACIEDGDIMLKFERNAWVSVYGILLSNWRRMIRKRT